MFLVGELRYNSVLAGRANSSGEQQQKKVRCLLAMNQSAPTSTDCPSELGLFGNQGSYNSNITAFAEERSDDVVKYYG